MIMDNFKNKNTFVLFYFYFIAVSFGIMKEAMNKTVKYKSILLVLFLSCQAGAIDFSDPGKFNPVWDSANPGQFYSDNLPTAALLGNGSLGVVNGGDEDCKLFVLTRGDLWSCGNLKNGNRPENITPYSFADLELSPGKQTVKLKDKLVLPSAMLETEGSFGKGKVKFDSFVASNEDLFVIEGISDKDDIWKIKLSAHGKETDEELSKAGIRQKTASCGLNKESIWVERHTINLLPKEERRGWITNATATVCVLGANLEKKTKENERSVSAKLKISARKRFIIIVGCNKTEEELKKYDFEKIEKIKQEHLEWWKEWWNRSRVATGDEELDRFYCGQVYLLGAGVRKGKTPPGLYGIWQTTDKPKWHNDIHLNYNYIATMYGCFAANRCEAAEIMPDPLLEYMPRAKENAKLRLNRIDNCWGRHYKATRDWLDKRKDLAEGIEGAALYPVALSPRGESAEGDDVYWSQISDGVFQCSFFCTHWEYTLDEEYLLKIWPLLEATEKFMLAWREKEIMPEGIMPDGYRYNIWDSHWEGSGLQKNSVPALACTKHLFETLVSVAETLRKKEIEISKERLESWIDMRDHLSPLPAGVYNIEGKPILMLSGTENADGSANPSGGNALNLESVIPGEVFAFDTMPEFREAACNAVEGNIAFSPKHVWSGINQTSKLFATATRAGYPAAKTIEAFKKHQLRLMAKNFHIHDGVHGVEKIGSMEFIHSMMLQCDRGYVKLFPNWTGADAAFDGLRAKGGFVISARLKDGRIIDVKIKSEKGGWLRLVDSFNAASRESPAGWRRGRTRNSGEPTLERCFRPGESAVLAASVE